MNRIPHLLIALLAAAVLPTAQAAPTTQIIDFEDFPIGPNSHFFPRDSGNFDVGGGVLFNHDYDTQYGSWGGWTISNESNLTTPGYENQFSAFATTDAGSNNYALAYAAVGGWGTTPTITFAGPTQLQSALFTNTTYAVLSMLHGDGFAKPFGGLSGNDPDFFVLTINGHDADGAIVSSLDFYLADFRFDDNSLDYIVNDWTQVNLASLGTVNGLSFTMDSSDFNPYGYGINTPAYFGLDNLAITAVPEPETYAMLLAGLGLIGGIARRRRRS